MTDKAHLNKINLLLFSLLIFFICLRFYAIEADPPAFIDFSMGNFTDEGYKTDFIRTIFLGKTEQVFLQPYCEDCDYQNPTALNNIIVNGFFLCGFALFGVGFFTIRLTAIILSLISMYFFCVAIKKYFGVKMALVTGLLLASSFVFFSFNRLALLENFTLLFVSLSFFCLVSFKNWQAKFFSLTCLLFAFFCKFASSSALPVAVNNIPNSLLLICRDYAIAAFNRVFRYSVLLYVIGLISAFLFLRNKQKFSTGQLQAITFCFIWLFGGLLILGFFTYQPSRYFYLLLLPLAFFAGYWFCFSKWHPKARVVIFSCLLLSQLFLFAGWANDLQFSQYNSSKEFVEIMNTFDDPIAAGGWCPTLAIESNVLCQRGGIGVPFKESLLLSLNVDVLAVNSSDWERFEKTYTNYSSLEFVFLKELQINKNRIFLFELKRRLLNERDNH